MYEKPLPPGISPWSPASLRQLLPLPSAPPFYKNQENTLEDFMDTFKRQFSEDVLDDILMMSNGMRAEKARVLGVLRTMRRHVKDVWREMSLKGEKHGLELQLKMAEYADLAAEQILDELESAFKDEVIPLDHYLSTVRTVSRDQFYQRAYTLKIRKLLKKSHGS